MQVVSFSKLNPLLMFKFYRKGLKKHGYLKDEGGSMRFTRRYNHMMRNLLASLHFYAKTAYISVGLLPLWFFLGKKIVGNYFIVQFCDTLFYRRAFCFQERCMAEILETNRINAIT